MQKHFKLAPLFLSLAFCLPLYAAQSNQSTQAVKEEIKEHLKDPYSAKISNIQIIGKTACAYVNAKNSYGAYTGKQVALLYLNNGRWALNDFYNTRIENCIQMAKGRIQRDKANKIAKEKALKKQQEANLPNPEKLKLAQKRGKKLAQQLNDDAQKQDASEMIRFNQLLASSNTLPLTDDTQETALNKAKELLNSQYQYDDNNQCWLARKEHCLKITSLKTVQQGDTELLYVLATDEKSQNAQAVFNDYSAFIISNNAKTNENFQSSMSRHDDSVTYKKEDLKFVQLGKNLYGWQITGCSSNTGTQLCTTSFYAPYPNILNQTGQIISRLQQKEYFSEPSQRGLAFLANATIRIDNLSDPDATIYPIKVRYQGEDFGHAFTTKIVNYTFNPDTLRYDVDKAFKEQMMQSNHGDLFTRF